MLTVALPKGELLKNSIHILQDVGLDFSAFLDSGNRQLQITDSSGQAKGLLVRAQDVLGLCRIRSGTVGYCWLRRIAGEKTASRASS